MQAQSSSVYFWMRSSSGIPAYATRESGPGLLPWYFLPVLTFLSGLLLTLSLDGKKRWIPVAIFGGFAAANACLIVIDCSADPTNHNL
jgi:hypothetical protein